MLVNLPEYFPAIFGTNKRQESLGRMLLSVKARWVGLGHLRRWATFSWDVWGHSELPPRLTRRASLAGESWRELRAEEFSNSGKSQKIWSVTFKTCHHLSPPALGNHQSFCLYRFAGFGPFIYMESYHVWLCVCVCLTSFPEHMFLRFLRVVTFICRHSFLLPTRNDIA